MAIDHGRPLWRLAFIDPAQSRSTKLDAFEIEKATLLFKVPLTFKTMTEMNEALHISLSNAKDDIRNVTFRIASGKFELTMPMQVVN